MSVSTPTDTACGAATIAVARSLADLREWVAGRRAAGMRIGLVPTMGALHEGHLSLVELAAVDDHAVVMSIFVNPTQFGPSEDFDAYPRDEAHDFALAQASGVGCVFAPPAEVMYPDGFSTTVSVSGPSRGFEGAARPSHFDGVATVVAKLLLAVRPHRAVFGAKDAQQLAVIRRLVLDLHLDDLDLIEAPTIREDDGLAMSSRNRYLTEDDRRAARGLSRGLFAAMALADRGETSSVALIAAARHEMESEPRCEIEYVALVDAESFQPIAQLTSRSARLCTAARVGPARLIDNVPLRATAH
ncbi:MAG: pantoate--beta-alanine ligase [Thermoleophilia bacterium]|nr:pantoate--beta-alanine ligase [Thermoleophilia bacterium]